jgi:hypothetical protein
MQKERFVLDIYGHFQKKYGEKKFLTIYECITQYLDVQQVLGNYQIFILGYDEMF